ncbi:hypothetical protein M378DRAFT_15436 [Amanita muscaria Koide BX008]|uniref:AAA+ ATPase domain-containing protein n=1 Tax=Amanita muscaria (strain Koide BX008) TaxID=946122 RepID=A0A0C2SWV3_AMAMK|nr:hypothetical protein M378DRAFT_15436 [Amanita muscaria Koide BX008]
MPWPHVLHEASICRQQTPEFVDNDRDTVCPAVMLLARWPDVDHVPHQTHICRQQTPESIDNDRGILHPAVVSPARWPDVDHVPHQNPICRQQTPESIYNDREIRVVDPAISNSDDATSIYINQVDDGRDSIDNLEEECLNTVKELAQGIIKTRVNKFREYTILLVGETGTGKTTFLSLLANILSGRNAGEYVFIHDEANEAGGGERHSQTMFAKQYLFESNNGVKVCILDTPGFVDTRGLEQDTQHKASIVGTIKDHIPTINAVLVLANGTLPRLGAATEYALSTLSSIFPRSLADNIGILFTNVDDRLSWNFDQKSVPESLRDIDRQFFVNNPLAKWKKYVELCSQQGLKKKEHAKLKGTIREAHEKALAELVLVFDWLDTLEPQPTTEILHLYEKSLEIDRNISSFLASARQSASKKARLQMVLKDVNNTRTTMEKYQHYQNVAKEKVWKLCPTLEANTICLLPDCYSNCPINRTELDKSHRSNTSTWEEYWGQHIPVAVGRPAARLISSYFSIYNYLFLTDCPRCKHPYHHHTHDRVEWRQMDHQRIVINRDAEKKYTGAKNENEKQEALKATIQETIDDLSEEIEDCLNRLGLLTEEYANLSLSGSFAGQVRKTVVLLELNLESMRNNGTDSDSVRNVEESLERMKEMLSILEKTKAKLREQFVRLPEPRRQLRPLLLAPHTN